MISISAKCSSINKCQISLSSVQFYYVYIFDIYMNEYAIHYTWRWITQSPRVKCVLLIVGKIYKFRESPSVLLLLVVCTHKLSGTGQGKHPKPVLIYKNSEWNFRLW